MRVLHAKIHLIVAILVSELSSATIYLTDGDMTTAYASLPALFGKSLEDGKTYQARLQFLHENPYLCEPVDVNASSFVKPRAPKAGGNATSSALASVTPPIAILAARGSCPFQRKAEIAEAIDPSVEFLIVYNFNYDSEDTLVPMYSEFGDTRLALLSVTHRTGQSLKVRIKDTEDLEPEVYRQGGPLMQLDSELPEGLLSVDDLRDLLLSAVGLFFMLISFSGCVMILAGAYGQHLQVRDGRVVVIATGPGPRRHLLTESDIQLLKDEAAAAGESSTAPSDADAVCSVCLDEFAEDSSSMVLPCSHRFHADCIVPWLTERQSKCPLCKFDVGAHIRERTASDNKPSWLDQWLRRRWTAVDAEPTGDGVIISPEEMEPELELTEQRLT